MEPFRCIIDRQVRKSFNTGQCKADDFKVFKNEYVLKHEKNGEYMRLFYDALIPHKMEVFMYIRDYYRCFMQQKGRESYPQFTI
jgi:CRISPR-associated protein Cas1